VRQVARHADARAANAFESGLRGHLIQARFTGFVPQHVITGPGVLACVDLADPGRRIAIEADGYSVHGDRRSFARDLQRHDELAALGWVTLRFAWEHVMFRPEWVVDQVRAVRRRRRRTDRRHNGRSQRSAAT
jgi:very-short-patch-repair endonuclease